MRDKILYKNYIAITMVYLLFGCTSIESVLSVNQSQSLPEPMDVSPFQNEAQQIQDRLLQNFLLGSYVVSRENKKPTHLGDSILWTMLTAASISCEKAAPLFLGVRDSIEENNGLLLRIDPLPTTLAKDPTSRDMEIGFAFGMTILYKNCLEFRDQIKKVWATHIGYIFSEANALAKDGPRSKIDITPTLRYLLTEVSHYIIENFERPSVIDQFLLDSSTNISALGRAISRKESCYPIHLTTLTYLTLDIIGSSVGESNKMLLCKTSKGLGLTLTDWYCKRSHVLTFLEKFKLNEYEYKHQRCDYEQPDVDPGIESPAVDYLVAYAAFGGHFSRLSPP